VQLADALARGISQPVEVDESRFLGGDGHLKIGLRRHQHILQPASAQTDVAMWDRS
jgi:hypothetical protein